MEQHLNNIFLSGILFCVLNFLSGSIPFGFLYGLIRGVDIRKEGSGNIGATNVGRLFGFWQGFIPITLLDMLKGAIGVILYRVFVSNDQSTLFYTMEILIGTSAILGHSFTPWLGFKGGKGVATTAGVLFVISPVVALLSLLIFLLTFFTFGNKIVGRSSVVAGICFPLIVCLIPDTNLPFQIMSFILSILVVFLHKKNIKAWMSGEDMLDKKQKNKS